MRVTVCLAVYNGGATLREALQTVFDQTYRDFDVLVVDDGSTDDSLKIAKEFDCRVISVKNAGLGAARRLMVEEATGELIAFIDHDDFWLPEKLEKQVEHIDRTGAAMVHTDGWYVYEDGHVVERNLQIPDDACPFDHILPGNIVIASSALFRRKDMLEAGNFVDKTVRCSDWYGWFVLAPGRTFSHLPEKLVRYSVLSTSLANAGFRFHEAQHFLLTRMILPRREELFAGLTDEQKLKYKQLIIRDVGIALSGMAKYKSLQGKPKEARKLHWQAIRSAPDVLRVWTRAARSLFNN